MSATERAGVPAAQRIAVAGGTGTVGRQVVDQLRSTGREVLVLSRSAGVDLIDGSGLADALAGVHAVIDVTSTATQSADASRRFFGRVTQRLLDAERAVGVRHHVALGIVGSVDAPFGYYAGKAEQERLIEQGDVPWTILRATQFHEFAQQMHRQFTIGRVGLVPRMDSQPVAASEVAERLIALALAEPAGRVADLAGPERLRMLDMVRAYTRSIGSRSLIVEVPLPGGFGKALRDGTVLPGPGADLGVQTFAEWLAARH